MYMSEDLLQNDAFPGGDYHHDYHYKKCTHANGGLVCCYIYIYNALSLYSVSLSFTYTIQERFSNFQTDAIFCNECAIYIYAFYYF